MSGMTVCILYNFHGSPLRDRLSSMDLLDRGSLGVPDPLLDLGIPSAQYAYPRGIIPVLALAVYSFRRFSVGNTSQITM